MMHRKFPVMNYEHIHILQQNKSNNSLERERGDAVERRLACRAKVPGFKTLLSILQ